MGDFTKEKPESTYGPLQCPNTEEDPGDVSPPWDLQPETRCTVRNDQGDTWK